MFVIRRAKVEDVSTLLKLARMVHFINLPADKEIIDDRVSWSRQCFMLAAEADDHGRAGRESRNGAKPRGRRGRGGDDGAGVIASGVASLSGRSPAFMMVMEDTEQDAGVIGTCQIISKMGGPGQPNVSLQLSRKHMFSQSLQVGVTHTTAKIHLDETGPTEIGGLILQPSYRGHRQRLGRFLSLVRFHFMGLHRTMFSSRVLAEMMGPISMDGFNPFWEHCARSFINLSYDDADAFSAKGKEFILTLYPREEIYLTLLPPEARAVVGQVGAETVPARKMLERLGFKYHDRVDPFDGGPHLEAALDEITVVKETSRALLGAAVGDDAPLAKFGMVSVLDDDGEFRAVQTAYDMTRQGKITLPRAAMAALLAQPGREAGVTPLSGGGPVAAQGKTAALKSTRRTSRGKAAS